jgi:hypothetical protein
MADFDQRITFRLTGRDKARLTRQAQQEGGTSTALLRAIVVAYLNWHVGYIGVSAGLVAIDIGKRLAVSV